MKSKLWFTSNSGRIEFHMTLEQAESGSHQGSCDSDIKELSRVPEIATQLESIAPELVASELKEYGAWDAEELQDHKQNLQRLLWIACSDIAERGKDQA